MSVEDRIEAMVRAIRDGTAPEAARAAAARGALPLPRNALAEIFVALREDPDASIRKAANESLDTLDSGAVLEILEDPSCAPSVMVHFATVGARDEKIAERIALRNDAPSDAMARLASHGSAPVVELLLTNQERLLKEPSLFDRLSTNPAVRPDQHGRMVELLGRVAAFRSDEAGRNGEDSESEPGSDDGLDLQEAARLLDVDVGEIYAESEILGGDEFARSEDAEIRGAYQRILTLTTGQRALLAIKGGREERMILIRDTNKLVSLSVLKNGRMTEAEVEQVSAMRNVSQDVLRAVGTNREWVKNYTIVKNLVQNPRTPPGVATNFVSRLNTRDIKFLARDKNVSELIRRMAKKTIDTRNQRSKSSFRK